MMVIDEKFVNRRIPYLYGFHNKPIIAIKTPVNKLSSPIDITARKSPGLVFPTALCFFQFNYLSLSLISHFGARQDNLRSFSRLLTAGFIFLSAATSAPRDKTLSIFS